MKALISFLVLLLLIQAAAFINLGCAKVDKLRTDSNQGMTIAGHKKIPTMTVNNRKLKESINSKDADDPGQLHLEDYRPINPVPSSKASKHGTILRGTPLLPFIPKGSPPPTPPKHGNFP